MMVITGSLERRLTLEWKDTATTTISGIKTFTSWIDIVYNFLKFSFHIPAWGQEALSPQRCGGQGSGGSWQGSYTRENTIIITIIMHEEWGLTSSTWTQKHIFYQHHSDCRLDEPGINRSSSGSSHGSGDLSPCACVGDKKWNGRVVREIAKGSFQSPEIVNFQNSKLQNLERDEKCN